MLTSDFMILPRMEVSMKSGEGQSRNVIEDISFPVLTGCVVPMVDEFMLECSEETLNTGVVTAAPSLRHIGDNDVSGEQQLVPHGGILAARPEGAGALPVGPGLPTPW